MNPVRIFDRYVNEGKRRKGSVLIMVLAVVSLLALAAWTFCDVMVTETAAVAAYSRKAERRLLVDSGIDWARARLSRSHRLRQSDSGHSGRSFAGETQSPDSGWTSLSFSDRGEFWIVHRIPGGLDFESSAGPFNRSGLIDINAISRIEEKFGRSTAKQFLTAIPSMTSVIADEIIDSRQTFSELAELTSLPGITMAQIFGEDQNGNQLLDAHEDENGNGQLDAGWSEFMTTTAGEYNRRDDGSKKINLNQSDLANLFDQLESKFGTQLAQFVVAFRMHGELSDLSLTSESQSSSEQKESARLRGMLQRGEDISNESGSLPMVSRNAESSDDLKRGGLDLSIGPVLRIESLVDLFGTTVRTLVDGQDTILPAPWSNEPNVMSRQLTILEKELALTDERIVRGRINILSAPPTVLMAVPEMTGRIADAIVSHRNQSSNQPDTIAWLLEEEVLTWQEFRRMAPFITIGGDYFEAVVVAKVQVPGKINSVLGSRVDVDATHRVPQLFKFRELSTTEARRWLMAVPIRQDTNATRTDSVRTTIVPKNGQPHRMATEIDVGRESPIRF